MGTPNTNIPIDDGGLDSPTLPPWIREEIPRQAESPIIPCLMMRSISMVFDGHESCKAITVQGVDLGDGTIHISITLSDF
ncbi:MAG TPA: hypothetical protein VFI68_14335 [Anaerolineales bacterium]|nr:hypothetical protein [Anaerolineales bacterium]